MRRFLLIVLMTLLVPSSVMVLAAQSSVQSQRGDPPTAALITVSTPDAQGIVTIAGATGAVFPGAQVAIRNLFTEEVVYTQAGLTGTFSARLYGPGNTPFWISPAVSIPNEIRNQPGSMPGGPGTIIYGTDTRPPSESKPVTQLLIDGQVDDWSAYPESLLLKGVAQSVYGLHNDESLYSAVTSPLDSYWKMRVEFTLEGASYELMLDPRLSTEAATWRRTAPTEQDLGSLAVATTQADVVEMRIPFVSLSATLGVALESATMEQVEFLDAEGSPLRTVTVAQPLLAVDEIDGPVVAAQSRMEDGVNFTLSGPVAQGAAHWHARGQINTLNTAPGARLHLQMDVTLNAPDMPDLLVGMKMIGTLSLQPITDAQGQAVVGGLYSNNGWSAVKTHSGMPVDNLRSDFVLDETLVPAPQVLRRGDDLIFALDFDLELPSDLRAGTYGLIFKGAAQMGDDAPFDWTDNSLLGQGPGISPVQISRLPVILTVGDVSNARRLIWSLFVDQPSEGSRGVLADEDQDRVGLSNRIRYNSPTYILSPFSDPAGRNPRTYPLEPYLMNLMPNTYESTAAPLIPFSLPGGQISVRVTRPDGTVDDLGQVPITQNRLSTAEMDDRRLFGGQSQVDVYRLTSSNPAFRSYIFDQYGPYTIRMAGSVEDIWGNHYDGGGTYHVLAAEMLDMQPGVLSGTPFEVGDVFYPGLQISPGAAADVRVSMRLYPLDGSPVIEQTVEGKANGFGYFAPADSGFSFDVPGEYVVDYEARFTDSRQRLWAGSLRGVGVVASPDSAIIAHGQRGLNGYYPNIVPAWFTTRSYGPDRGPYHMNYPYQRGDVLWYMADGPDTVQPGLTIQDSIGDYAKWLIGALPDYLGPDGASLERHAARAELPIIAPHPNPSLTDGGPENPLADAYSYLSAVRPGLTVRQFVEGAENGGLSLYWDMNDPYNQQIGSGLTGDLPGDYVFLFGGAVIRSEQAGIAESAIYGASAFVTDERDTKGARVLPPYWGEAGAADSGPLMTLHGQPIEMFFHPTSLRPGMILEQGNTLAIAGQIAPTLASKIHVTITSPSGEIHDFSGKANAIGYYYNPANDFVVDEPGIWTVQIDVWHSGQTSAGPVHEPYPHGSVLGSTDGRFGIYVVPPGNPLLEWNDTRQDFSIPGAIPYNFNFRIPSGWTNVRVDHTLTSPGFILKSGPLPISGASFTFQHNPTNLNAAFPNLEVDARLEGPAASDPVVLTIAVTGTDAHGDPQILSRMFTIMYDRLISLEATS